MLRIFTDKAQLSNAAAELFVSAASQAVAANGRFVVALTGGSSPRDLYRLLTESPYREAVPWQHCFVFWGDERWVPTTDERSNARMADETLLSKVPIPANQIFHMWGADTTPESFAVQYEQQLLDTFGSDAPQFDLILLGMGDDGHTASLFPGTEVLEERERLVAAYYLEPQQMHRITFTAPLINQAKTIAFITFGAGKAPALKQVLEGVHDPVRYPSQLIRKDPDSVHWFVDQDAAALLSNK